MDVLMPQLGETVAEGKITKWFKQAGDEVKPGENLFEIETDKTSMEVPSTVAGKLTAINVGVGDVAKVGAVVAVIGGAGTSAKTAAPPPMPTPQVAKPQIPAAVQQLYKPSVAMDPFREVRTPERNYGPANVGGRQVTPLARRLAGERGIDLANIKGSGPHGRVVAGDIEALGAKSVAIETRHAAPLYLVADIEIGRLLALCAEANAAAPKGKSGEPVFELSQGDFIVKAWAAALQRFPAANAIWTGDRAHRLESSDIGVTIVLESGTVTPVIRDAQAKSLTAISSEMRDLSIRAHDNRLMAAEPQGGASAITNLGMYGVREFSAIIKPPHSSVLAIGAPRRAATESEDGSVKFVTMTTVTLSCDHRVIEEALGARLLAAFKALMENPVTALI